MESNRQLSAAAWFVVDLLTTNRTDEVLEVYERLPQKEQIDLIVHLFLQKSLTEYHKLRDVLAADNTRRYIENTTRRR